MDRRLFLAGAAAALASPTYAAATASRRFRIIRDGSDIGTHTLDARLDGDVFDISITIRIAVKVLGITAYRYEMDNRERWRGGELISLDSRVNDDGEKAFARASREGGTLNVEGSGHNGTAPAGIATTSYFSTEFMGRRPWLSTQTGKPLTVNTAQQAGGWWQVSGGLETRLRYDGRGEWVGCEFDAGGEAASYEITSESGAIAGLWAGA